jgi:hypothetical protein
MSCIFDKGPVPNDAVSLVKAEATSVSEEDPDEGRVLRMIDIPSSRLDTVPLVLRHIDMLV